ncbi:hypothetical protein [Alloactinosynnema sp. L-07]|uniref:hypothetical protein n=1 Tax=Alloactinosynnema sp. L-07 TaxID=1653480 RepID=UPI00065EF3CC|nr:hypothetical protein [Alloactinosynnema sp. L-07]CRK59346.1 hypothetical protein [Alloactinosynnema sp. L-07]
MSKSRELPGVIDVLTPTAATALVDAAARAASTGETTTGPALLVAALTDLAERPGRLRTVLTGLVGVLPTGHEPVGAPGGLVPPSVELRALIDAAVGMAATTGEAAAATPHLLAAAVEAGFAPDLAERGVTADHVLAWAARTRSTATCDDLVPTTRPVRAPVGAAPTAPLPEDLARRTSGRRSALVAGLLRDQLPSGRRISGPLVRKRMRWYLAAVLVGRLSGVAAAVLLARHLVDTGDYWLLPLVLVFGVAPENSSPLAHVLVRVPVVLLGTPLTGLFVLGNVIGALVETWHGIWMLRIDRGDPRLPFGAIARAYWRRSRIVGEQWWDRVAR